ncbi:MAG: tRNA pseudouridine(13) synthase TruD [Halioglobus sp.]
MSGHWPTAAGDPVASGQLRSCPEDFRVYEELGFEPDGDGEHALLHLEKRELNTTDLAQRLSSLSGIHLRDISFSGMKDRNAITRQWFSVRMAGKTEPDWQQLASQGDVAVLNASRHRRKLKRGVHRNNYFSLVLRGLTGDPAIIEARLQQLRLRGAPNYFGEQRFGRDGSTLVQAKSWIASGGRRLSRNKRTLYLSVLRSQLFNSLLADRVNRGDWDQVLPGDTCILRGTRSQFSCEQVDTDIIERCRTGDLHPALPLWGLGIDQLNDALTERWWTVLRDQRDIGDFLIKQGLELGQRATRLIADDFCWQFCDDDTLQLEFRLGAGNYATALLAEFVQYDQPRAH